MLPSARLYNCLRCHTQVVICRRCDRGQRYCSAHCSGHARRDSLRRSAKRYRTSVAGRHNNAERQRRYRQRRREEDKKKVTHHGSTPACRTALLLNRPSVERRAVIQSRFPRRQSTLRCHCCDQVCDPFLRRRFLRTSSLHGRRSHLTSVPTAPGSVRHGN